MARNHCLELSGGLGWNIVASDEAAHWTDEFARILSLREGLAARYPNLIIKRHRESTSSEEWHVMGSRHVSFYKHAGTNDIECLLGEEQEQKKEYYKMWDLLLPVYEGVREEGGIPFHAALLVRNNKAVLLSGRGGTGKSTCARRAPPPWRALSDDECLIVADGRNGYRVHPLPTWSDYLLKRSAPVWAVGQAVRLVGIFFLKQAGVDEAIPLGSGEASMRAYEASRQVCQYSRMTREKEEMRAGNVQMLDNATRLVRTVPAFTLNFTLQGNFWEAIERGLAEHGG